MHEDGIELTIAWFEGGEFLLFSLARFYVEVGIDCDTGCSKSITAFEIGPEIDRYLVDVTLPFRSA